MEGQCRDGENAPDAALVRRWRVADHRPEQSAERTRAFVTDFEADLRDRQLIAGEQSFGAIDPHLCYELVRRLAKGVRKQAVIMVGREAGLARCVRESYRVGDASGHPVARTAQPAEQLVIDNRT